MSAAWSVELLKFRRSRVVQAATLGLLLIPAAIARGFLAAAMRDGSDPASMKARAMLPGTGWVGYLGGLIQIEATGGVVGVGIVIGWCFGREFADRTVESLYASVTPREQVVRAKLLLVSAWAGLVGVGLGVVAYLLGLVTGLGPLDAEAAAALGRLVLLAVLPGLLALPVALAASAGRGYLPAVGALLVLVLVAQVAMILGAGEWWPWSVVALWAMGPAAGMPTIGPMALLMAPAVGLLGGLATMWWWHRAEVV